MALENLIIENATIGRKNFGGRESDFNDAGKRNFCVYFDEEMGKNLADEGWPIKFTKPRDDGSVEAMLPVSLRFDVMPPNIIVINSVGQRQIGEDEASDLDDYRLKLIDLIIRPYSYDYHGKKGIKAYLKSMYATIDEDVFQKKYANVPFIK